MINIEYLYEAPDTRRISFDVYLPNVGEFLKFYRNKQNLYSHVTSFIEEYVSNAFNRNNITDCDKFYVSAQPAFSNWTVKNLNKTGWDYLFNNYKDLCNFVYECLDELKLDN